MPPDISAGLSALAAAPPGAAFSAGPPLPEPLSASLFAAFLAQSSPPSVTPAAPKAAAPTLTTDSKQMPLEKQALPKSKTMDTLPTLSFSLMPKMKAKASELPFSQSAKHQKAADDQSSADVGTPAPNAPGLVPALAGQSAAPPAALFAAPVPTPPAAAVPVPPAPAPVQAAPVSQSRPATPALTLPRAAAPVQAAPLQTVLPLPRTWALAAPLQTAPLQTVLQVQPPLPTLPSAGAKQTPDAKALSVSAVKPAAGTTAQAAKASGLPCVPSPVSPVPVQAVPQAQAVPQDAMPDLLPSAAQAVSQNIPIPSPAIAVVAAALPAPETPKSNPAKITGKLLPPALKAAGENADTSTRATPGQDRTVSVQADVPAAAPNVQALEKHAEEQKPSETDDSSTNSLQIAAQATAPADTAKAEAKPLSAGERAEVVRQAAEAVTKMPLPAKPGGPEQMSVQLHPKDWGSLQVSVSVAPSQNAGAAKTVTAHIVAETPQVKAALQSGTGALHQALRASGLHLEHLTVSVKAPEVKAIDIKPAAQSASAGQSSGQSQSDTSGQSYGQPGAGPGGFGMGGSQNSREGQPPPAPLASAPEPEAEDDFFPATPLRPAPGRIDTRA